MTLRSGLQTTNAHALPCSMDKCAEAVALFLQLQYNFRKRKRLKYEDEYDDDDLIAVIALKGFGSNPSGSISQNKRRRVADYDAIEASVYNLDDFSSHFRMKRESVEAIETLVGKEYVHLNQPGRRPIPLRIAVLLTVWTLANQESFRGIGNRFHVAGGHAHRAFMTCCLIISRNAASYFLWPKTTVAIRKAASEFEALHGNVFPGVVGCIDGAHVPIKAPNEERHVYSNQQDITSIIVQAVCDANLKFTSVFAGWPGSFNKATVWRNSPLYHSIKPYSESWLDDTHLLGSTAYPLTDYLLTPYQNENLSQKQLHFNTLLNSKLSVIHRAFFLLKSRFHRLGHLEMSRIDMIPTVITTACVMHNICIQLGDVDIAVFPDDINDDSECEAEDTQDIPDTVRQKRDNLADYLFCLASTHD